MLRKTGFIFTAIFAFIVLLAAVCFSTERAALADTYTSTYTLGSSNKNYSLKISNKYVYSPIDGCTYVISLTDLYECPITKLSYTAYSIGYDREDLSRNTDGKIINPVSADNEGNKIQNISVNLTELRANGTEDPRTGNMKLTFEVTAYEWCAFVFNVSYEVDGENYDNESEPLYCALIDCSVPYIAISDGPILRDGGYMYTVLCRGNSLSETSPSLNSGMSKVRIYRVINGTTETIKTVTTFPDWSKYYAEVLVIKGEYFVEVTDGVGNISFGRVARLDYGLDEIIRNENIDAVLQNSALYTKELYENLRVKYYAWQVISGDTTAKVGDVKAAEDAVSEALKACNNAKLRLQDGSGFIIDVKNSESLPYGGIKISGLNYAAYPYAVYGEDIILQIAVASYAGEGFSAADFIDTLGGNTPDNIFALDFSMAGKTKIQYTSPISAEIPLGTGYKDVYAYAVNETGGARTYERLNIDKGTDRVTVYIPVNNTKIYIAYYEADENTDGNKLYWLFSLLAIPAAAGIVLAVYFVKKKKRGVKNS